MVSRDQHAMPTGGWALHTAAEKALRPDMLPRKGVRQWRVWRGLVEISPEACPTISLYSTVAE